VTEPLNIERVMCEDIRQGLGNQPSGHEVRGIPLVSSARVALPDTTMTDSKSVPLAMAELPFHFACIFSCADFKLHIYCLS